MKTVNENKLTASKKRSQNIAFFILGLLGYSIVAILVVVVELAVISWIRTRFMDTPFLQAAFQVVVGGTLVFAAGILIGSS